MSRLFALFFKASTDYLLDLKENATVSVEGLDDKEISAEVEIINCIRNKYKYWTHHRGYLQNDVSNFLYSFLLLTFLFSKEK